MEITLVLLKPDAYERNLIPKIMQRIEDKALRMVAIEMFNRPTRQVIEEHYKAYKDEWYFKLNVEFMTSGPVIAIAYEGDDAIKVLRQLQGKCNVPGTIRGDLANDVRRNLIHASENANEAVRELNLWFPEHMLGEKLKYQLEKNKMLCMNSETNY